MFYEKRLREIATYKRIITAGLLGTLLMTFVIVPQYPKEFIPQADRGIAYTITSLNSNVPCILTVEVAEKIQKILNEEKDIRESGFLRALLAYSATSHLFQLIKDKVKMIVVTQS